MKKTLAGIAFGLLASLGIAVWAQQSGSGLPGGAMFSTQYKGSATGFLGAGPGTSGHVLTSNGAGMAPSFQAAAGATLTSTQVGFGSGANALTGEAAFNYNATTNTLDVDNLTVDACTGCGGGQTTGQFTITWTDACTVDASNVVDWTLDGNVVSWRINEMSPTFCTSDSTGFNAAVGTVPMSLRPSGDTSIYIQFVRDNTVNQDGCVVIDTDGSLAARHDPDAGCAGAAWTNSGSKGFASVGDLSITYRL